MGGSGSISVGTAAAHSGSYGLIEGPNSSGEIARVSGVAVALSGNNSASTTTDSNGDYSFNAAVGGTYTVTPSLSSYTVTPGSQSFSNLAGNEAVNFTANTTALSISGKVLRGGSSLSGVTVTLSGSASSAATTASNGAFSFFVQSGGDYTIVPSLSGYVFSHASGTFNGITSSQTATFAATSGNGGTTSVPPPPVACIDYGLTYSVSSSGANPQTA
jgi:hypothetical protein